MNQVKFLGLTIRIEEFNYKLKEMGCDNLFENEVMLAGFMAMCEEARELTTKGPAKTQNVKLVLAVSKVIITKNENASAAEQAHGEQISLERNMATRAKIPRS